MWIVCPTDDSHVMSSIISSENYIEHALKMSSASRDWHFKGLNQLWAINDETCNRNVWPVNTVRSELSLVAWFIFGFKGICWVYIEGSEQTEQEQANVSVHFMHMPSWSFCHSLTGINTNKNKSRCHKNYQECFLIIQELLSAKACRIVWLTYTQLSEPWHVTCF